MFNQKSKEMKKRFFLLPILLLGLFVAISSCEEEDEETCEADVFCEQKEVTVCCTGADCVYKFGEKEYADTKEDLEQLATDLGCTAKKSATYESDMAMIKQRLQIIKDAALARQY